MPGLSNSLTAAGVSGQEGQPSLSAANAAITGAAMAGGSSAFPQWARYGLQRKSCLTCLTPLTCKSWSPVAWLSAQCGDEFLAVGAREPLGFE